MSRRIQRTFALISALALLPAVGCDDKKGDDKGKADAKKSADNTKKADDVKTPEVKEEPKPEPKMVEMALARTGLSITLPEGATIDEAIIAGADEVTFPGVQSKMVVKPRLVTDKELDAHMEWAKGHQIQKFQKEILKEGEGKTYTYMHAVDMSGMSKVVYMQMFQIGDKDFACFSNADNEEAARAMKAACDTVKAGGAGDGEAAADGEAPADGEAAADDKEG